VKYFYLALVLFLLILLQSAFLSLPLVLAALIILCAYKRESWIFLVAFCSGTVLDALAFRTVGVSSLFFVGMLGAIFLYQKKYEIQSPFFIFVSCFLFSLLYAALFIHNWVVLSAIVSAMVAVGSYVVCVRSGLLSS